MEIKNQQLECVLYINYLVKFKKGHTEDQALINSDGEINTMTVAYAAVLEVCIYVTNIEASKIDRSTLLTYSMVLVNF